MRRQDGFSVVELLVAATLSIVLFGATLTILDVYNRQSTANTQRNDAQDRARVGIDRIVRNLRNIASPITSPKLLERATPYDLVFQTIAPATGGVPPANGTGAERVRYCVPSDTLAGSPANEVLISEVQTWSTQTPPASPWASDPSVTLSCPDSPLPSSTTMSVLAPSITNRYRGRTDRPAFAYDNGLDANNVAVGDLIKVASVQIDLFVNPTPSLSDAETELRSSAFLRNQVHTPVAGFTYTPTGGGGVLLNGATSYSPDGLSLTYGWSCVSWPCPSASALSAQTDGLVDWQPGAGSYTVQLTVSDPTGLTATDTQQVTVT